MAAKELSMKLLQEMKSTKFKVSLFMGCLSGVAGGLLRYSDSNYGLAFLEDIVPDKIVMNGFFIFASLVASFRTSHALAQYTDAASYFQQLRAAWFDAGTTLFAFCRDSKAPPEAIQQFQQALVRLISLMNALCLEKLSSDADRNGRNKDDGFSFEILSPQTFHSDFLEAVSSSEDKPELLMQSLEQLIMDAKGNGVLDVPAPLLTRSIIELSKGYSVYTEAKKLACIPFPFSYIFFGFIVLFATSFATPFMLAVYCRGVVSTFIFTFGANFLLWYVNLVANSLNNPYQKQARLIDGQAMQQELNSNLIQLIETVQAPLVHCEFDEDEIAGIKAVTNKGVNDDPAYGSEAAAAAMTAKKSLGRRTTLQDFERALSKGKLK